MKVVFQFPFRNICASAALREINDLEFLWWPIDDATPPLRNGSSERYHKTYRIRPQVTAMK